MENTLISPEQPKNPPQPWSTPTFERLPLNEALVGTNVTWDLDSYS